MSTMKVRYTNINGNIVAEKRGGTRSAYVPDALGSTAAILNGAQQKTDTFEYWPYGENRDRSGTSHTAFQFGGTQGYYSDDRGRQYVRSRHLQTVLARWQTPELRTSDQSGNRYLYVRDSPLSWVDPKGSFGIPVGWLPPDPLTLSIVPACAALAYKYITDMGIRQRPWWPNHDTDKLAHCTVGCILTICAGVIVTEVLGFYKELNIWPFWEKDTWDSFLDPQDICANREGEWCAAQLGVAGGSCLGCCLHMHWPTWPRFVGPPDFLRAPCWNPPPGTEFPKPCPPYVWGYGPNYDMFPP